MKKRLKQLLSLTLALCFLITPVSVLANAVEPRYNNTFSVTTAMTINEDGLMTIGYSYNGFDGVATKAIITTYIEKRTLLFFWERINIGMEDNQWVDRIARENYTYGREVQLYNSGTYRVKVTYKIYGSGGAADVIEYEGTDSF